MSSIERTGGELERFIPQGQLAERQAQELALVGFSPEFPVRVAELNDALVRFVDGSFNGFRFTLHPDEGHPKIDVEARHTFPFNVVIDAFTNRSAALAITPRDPARGGLGYLRLSQLRELTDVYPSDEDMILTAEPRYTLFKEDERPEPVKVPFTEVASVEDLSKLGIKPTKFDLAVGFKTGETKLSIAFTYPIEPRIDEPVFNLSEITAVDSSEHIESIIGSLATLLAKNAFVTGDIDE